MKNYPCIGSTIKLKVPDLRRCGRSINEKQGKRCWICGEKATVRNDIQVSWFRGDDEVVYACEAHKKAVAK